MIKIFSNLSRVFQNKRKLQNNKDRYSEGIQSKSFVTQNETTNIEIKTLKKSLESIDYLTQNLQSLPIKLKL